MSSSYVRTQVKTFVETAIAPTKLLDLSGEFREYKAMLADNGLNTLSDWVGVEFVPGDEIPITVGATNTSGKYREIGAIYFHIVGVARLGGSGSILTRAEALRTALRGKRIGNVLIESVTPANFSDGATLQFEGGQTGASILASYECDFDF